MPSSTEFAHPLANLLECLAGVGVWLVWMVDPRTRTLAAHHRNGAVIVLAETAILYEEDVLPGFTLPLTSRFTALHRGPGNARA